MALDFWVSDMAASHSVSQTFLDAVVCTNEIHALIGVALEDKSIQYLCRFL